MTVWVYGYVNLNCWFDLASSGNRLPKIFLGRVCLLQTLFGVTAVSWDLLRDVGEGGWMGDGYTNVAQVWSLLFLFGMTENSQ